MKSDLISIQGPSPKGGGLFHGSCVNVAGRGVLILGASGTGKSGLALTLMAYGATLVADDQVRISLRNGELVAEVPKTIEGRIEARFVGILAAEPAGPTVLNLVVDMDAQEKTRLPPKREIFLLGESLPLLHYRDVPHFSAAILQILKGSLES